MNTTTDILVNSYASVIGDAIVLACPNYREKFQIWDGIKYQHYEDGRDIMIRFLQMNADIPQMTI